MSVVPTWWLLSCLVVLELCQLILADYPGIAPAGILIVKWAMAATALISVAIAA
jgi:hypothetical protein